MHKASIAALANSKGTCSSWICWQLLQQYLERQQGGRVLTTLATSGQHPQSHISLVFIVALGSTVHQSVAVLWALDTSLVCVPVF